MMDIRAIKVFRVLKACKVRRVSKVPTAHREIPVIRERRGRVDRKVPGETKETPVHRALRETPEARERPGHRDFKVIRAHRDRREPAVHKDQTEQRAHKARRDSVETLASLARREPKGCRAIPEHKAHRGHKDSKGPPVHKDHRATMDRKATRGQIATRPTIVADGPMVTARDTIAVIVVVLTTAMMPNVPISAGVAIRIAETLRSIHAITFPVEALLSVSETDESQYRRFCDRSSVARDYWQAGDVHSGPS